MSPISNTRNMFNFVLLLYLIGFTAMMSRWRTVDETEIYLEEGEPMRKRRGAQELQPLQQMLNLHVEDLPKVAKLDDSLLKIDSDIPILNKGELDGSKESLPPRTEKAQKPKRKSKAPVNKSVKKQLEKDIIVKHNSVFVSQKETINEVKTHSDKDSVVNKKQTENERAKSLKETVPQKNIKVTQKKTVQEKPLLSEVIVPAKRPNIQAVKRKTVLQKKTVQENPLSESVVPAKSPNIQAAKKTNVNAKVAPAVPAPEHPKEEPRKLAKNEKQMRRRKRDPKSKWADEQAKRRTALRQACNRLENIDHRNISEMITTSKRSFWPFIFEDRYRLIYTYISKVASTNWKSAFLVLQGKYKKVEDVPGRFAHAQSLVKLSSLPDDEIKKRLENYSNFIFVRHPFARVLSAYRSKFLQPNKAFQKHAGVRIIKMYRPNATKEALETGSDVTFPEFVRYLANSKIINFDGHWQPIYKMVLPCTVRFDFIGKLETGEEDAKYILEETKVDHLVHFMETKRNVSHDVSTFNHFYSQVPSTDLVKLYKVYEPDFQLFGYEVPDSMKSLIKVT